MPVTTGAEWRRAREEGVEVELPTGRIVLLRPVTLYELTKTGQIPDPLLITANKALGVLTGKVELTPQDFKNQLEMIVFIARAAILSPKIVDTPKSEDEMAIYDLTQEEIDFIAEWAEKPQLKLTPFRSEQE